MNKNYYLAYGSNLDLLGMNKRCPDAKVIGTICLRNYKLVYRGSEDNFSYLTIEESNDSYVPLGLYEVSYLDILALDKYEGYPELYSKKYINVVVNGQKEKALIYVMKKKYDYHIPSLEYIRTCLKGYNCFEFDIHLLENALNDTLKSISSQKKLLPHRKKML